jgi:DNA end-binding protein Ku
LPASRDPLARARLLAQPSRMARSIWKGSISFGLVEIPVALVPAEQKDEIKFHLLDRRDFSPVGYRRYNKKTGEEVPWDEIVRGYEHEDGEFVIVTDEELQRVNPKATQTVAILDFVPADAIDPAYFDQPYYLTPSRKGSRAYALLRETLRRSGRTGIAKVVIRTKQHLAALTVRGPLLLLVLLRFAHEIRSPEDLGLTDELDAEVGPKELALAERLVDDMSGAWQPEQYRDDFRQEVLALVERKVAAGRTHQVLPPEELGEQPAPGKIIDLMALLKQSVGQKGARRSPSRPAKKKATARARRVSRRKGA